MLLLTFAKVLAIILVAHRLQPAESDDALRKTNRNKNFILPETTRPVQYELQLIPYLIEENFTFHGEINITMEVLKTTNDIVLHSENLIIDESVTTLISMPEKSIKPKKHIYDSSFDFLTLSFENLLVTGIYELRFKFTGKIGTDTSGFYRRSYWNKNGDSVWVAATHFQPHSARRVFPCWDEPTYTARFSVAIKHYPNYIALSNMPEDDQSTVEEDDMLWTSFRLTYFMGPNVLAFVLVDFDNISNANGTVKIWCPKEIMPYVEYAAEILENATEIMQEYTNTSVGIPKVDHVVFPGISGIANEYWGLTIYSYDAITYVPTVQPLSRKENNTMTMINQVSRMWSANIVMPSIWYHPWMVEGFATYFQYIVAEKLFPAWRVLDTYGVRKMAYIFEMDTPPTTSMNRNITNAKQNTLSYDPWVIYDKASALLRMTAYVLSEDLFQQSMVKYFQMRGDPGPAPDEFSEALQLVLDNSHVPHHQFKVKKFLDSWQNQAGYPLVTVTWDYQTGEILLTQEAFVPSRNFTGEFDISAKWWIPISYATQSNPNFEHSSPKVWMKPLDNVTKIEGVEVEDWIILNVQVTGLYRVNYDENNWKRIAHLLNSASYTEVHVVNRANLVNDAFDLFLIGRVNPIIFFQLLCYFERESDSVAWELGAKVLKRMYPYIMVPEQEDIFRLRITRLFDKIVDQMGFEEKPDGEHTINALRPQILKVACQYGHEICKKTAMEKIASYVTLLEEFRLHSEEEMWLPCVAIREDGDAAWQNVSDLYTKHGNKDTLMYLSCTKNATNFENFLEIMGQETSPISKHDFMGKVESILYLYSGNIDMFLNYCIKNKEKLKDVIVPIDLLRVATTKDRLEKVITNFSLDLEEEREALATVRAKIDIWEVARVEIGDWIKNEDQS